MPNLNVLMMLADKTGAIGIGERIRALGGTIYGSKGTVSKLKEGNVDAIDIATITGRGPILDHKVVSLNGDLHAGCLATGDDELAELEQLGIRRLDIVYINFYPLHAAINAANATVESVVKAWDIGGPTMLLSAAKGGRIPVTDPADMLRVLEQLETNGTINDTFRQELIEKAVFTVLAYYAPLCSFLSGGGYKVITGRRVSQHKKGENAWMGPYTVYTTDGGDPLSLPDHLIQEGGIDCSFVNYCDYERILQVLTHIAANFQANGWPMPYIAIAVKHGNPCGASFGRTAREALENMINGDTRAIHGAVVIINFRLDTVCAETLAYYNYTGPRKRILHSIIAPEIDGAAKEILQGKEEKCRFLTHSGLAMIAPFENLTADVLDRAERIHYIRGGFIAGSNYTKVFNVTNPNLVKEGADLSVDQQQTLAFGEAINMTSNSNCATLVKDRMLIGNGVGQQDRVGGSELAVKRATDAGHDTKGSLNIQDSFFPFPDGAERLIEAGVIMILATSGSTISGKKVRQVISEHGVTYWTLPDDEDRRFSNH
ncbi:MAG: hypothetical protein WC544_03510 [Patescibacteria group bacterium]